MNHRHSALARFFSKLLGLLLFTGQRRSDVVRFGKQHMVQPSAVSAEMRQAHSGPWLHFTQQKNRKRSPITLTIPIRPEVEHLIASSLCGDLTFLITAFGKPFTAAGFGNWFRDRCNEAGLRHCTAHGLRKAGATIAAENGATERQLMSVFGWRTSKQAVHYTRSANQKALAGSAMKLLSPNQQQTPKARDAK